MLYRGQMKRPSLSAGLIALILVGPPTLGFAQCSPDVPLAGPREAYDQLKANVQFAYENLHKKVPLFVTHPPSKKDTKTVTKPTPAPHFQFSWETARASYYGYTERMARLLRKLHLYVGGNDGFQGQRTACGKIFDTAQPTFATIDSQIPLGSVVEFSYKGRKARGIATDTGGFASLGRSFDLSMQLVAKLHYSTDGPLSYRVISRGHHTCPSPIGSAYYPDLSY